jgi:putative transposase
MEIKLPPKKYHYEQDRSGKEKLVYSCQFHVVFCTKYRRPILEGKTAERLKELIEKEQADHGYQVIEIEIKPDYVHLILDVNPKIGIYDVIGHIKRYTSSTLRKEFPELKKRVPSTWTNSAFISSIGLMDISVILNYIESQKGK